MLLSGEGIILRDNAYMITASTATTSPHRPDSMHSVRSLALAISQLAHYSKGLDTHQHQQPSGRQPPLTSRVTSAQRYSYGPPPSTLAARVVRANRHHCPGLRMQDCAHSDSQRVDWEAGDGEDGDGGSSVAELRVGHRGSLLTVMLVPVPRPSVPVCASACALADHQTYTNSCPCPCADRMTCVRRPKGRQTATHLGNRPPKSCSLR